MCIYHAFAVPYSFIINLEFCVFLLHLVSITESYRWINKKSDTYS